MILSLCKVHSKYCLAPLSIEYYFTSLESYWKLGIVYAFGKLGYTQQLCLFEICSYKDTYSTWAWECLPQCSIPIGANVGKLYLFHLDYSLSPQRSISDMTAKSCIWCPVDRLYLLPRGPVSCIGIPGTLLCASGKLSTFISGNYLECFIFCCSCDFDIFVHAFFVTELLEALKGEVLCSHAL